MDLGPRARARAWRRAAVAWKRYAELRASSEPGALTALWQAAAHAEAHATALDRLHARGQLGGSGNKSPAKKRTIAVTFIGGHSDSGNKSAPAECTVRCSSCGSPMPNTPGCRNCAAWAAAVMRGQPGAPMSPAALDFVSGIQFEAAVQRVLKDPTLAECVCGAASPIEGARAGCAACTGIVTALGEAPRRTFGTKHDIPPFTPARRGDCPRHDREPCDETRPYTCPARAPASAAQEGPRPIGRGGAEAPLGKIAKTSSRANASSTRKSDGPAVRFHRLELVKPGGGEK